MTLKNRLIISFIFMMCAPLCLIGATFTGILRFTESEKVMPAIKPFLTDMTLSIVLILLFTALMLTWWIYASIIIPIRRLQVAARYIKEGQLNYVLNTENMDIEMAQLGKDFEAMRLQLKQNQEEKETFDKRNRELIRNISHDLKTPITSIKGYVEGILDGVADTPEKQEKYLRIIYKKAEEMNRLINELTVYSQLDTSEIPYDFKVLSVKDCFGDCAEEIGMDLTEKNINFTYDNFCSEDVCIQADPEELSRVIGNIVGNSVKYMNKTPGNIRLSIKDVGSHVQIEIEDNGKGIAKGDLPFIFDRFYRTDESRNSSTGGSGIGLSIVKKIVEDHGGRIWATSELDHGTCMFIVLKKYKENEDGQ